MSSHTETHAHGSAGHVLPAVDHGHTAGHHDHQGGSHGTLASYMTGFILSVILTAIPFYLVMTGKLGSKDATAIAIMAFAVVQIFVHMIYFLHMNTKSEAGWSVLALMFTLILVVIALTGSLWVMYHLNANMMPTMSPHDAQQLP
jgi:cytochrome o ubiquinol oxidase operon protein cyoD